MPLQQLVEYFNDRFGLEHHSSFRPIMLENGLASGLFGPIRINSKFSPLHNPNKPDVISGYAAQLTVATYDPLLLQHQQIESLLANSEDHNINFDSIINFDRLARTIHMLNYLPIAHLEQTLFVDVDPRHILSIKKDHGAYFEEVITKCGLQTHNVVLVTGINTYFSHYYPELQTGFDNYRSRGYQIGLRFNAFNKSSQLLDSIHKLAPNFVCISTDTVAEKQNIADFSAKLQAIKARVDAINGSILLSNIRDESMGKLAIDHAVDLVEGSYYQPFSVD